MCRFRHAAMKLLPESAFPDFFIFLWGSRRFTGGFTEGGGVVSEVFTLLRYQEVCPSTVTSMTFLKEVS